MKLDIPVPRIHSMLYTGAEIWEMLNLKTHYMGPNSGLRNGEWPAGTHFNSTIDFEIVIFYDRDKQFKDTYPCSGNWTAPHYPKTWQPCNDPAMTFRFEETENFSEGHFTLDYQLIKPVPPEDEPIIEVGMGREIVISNAPGKRNNWLTCLGGPPLDGIRCSWDGMLSPKTPIPLVPMKLIVPIKGFSTARYFGRAREKKNGRRPGEMADSPDYVFGKDKNETSIEKR